MSVSKPLFVGVYEANLTQFVGAQVTVQLCKGAGDCVDGSGTISISGNVVMVSGSVEVQSAPYTVAMIRILSGGRVLAQIDNVNVVISSAGKYTVTMREHFEYQMPKDVTFTTDVNTAMAWTMTKGTVYASMYLSGNISTTGMTVEFHDQTGVKARDTAPSVSFTPSGARMSESISARIMQQMTLCKIVVKRDTLTLAEYAAKDASQCTNITGGAQIVITGTTYVTS